MSAESIKDLNNNTLIGFTDKRGFAWHHDGSNDNHYPGAIPVEDIRRRLFNWTAVEGSITATALTENGVIVTEDPDRKAILRSDTGAILGIFKKGYNPHQYVPWLEESVSAILDDDLQVGSAGLLKNGAVGWVSVEVPDSITTPEGVEFRPNLLACTSFDGSLATTYKRIVTNVVCDNTMAAGLGEEGQVFRIKHTKNSDLRLGDARDALAVVHTIADDFAAEVARLTAVHMSAPQWDAFVDILAPKVEDKGRSKTISDNKRDTLYRLWNTDTRVTPWKGTAWGALQAVNTYVHHEQLVRGTDRAQRNRLRAVTGGVDKLDADTAAILEEVLA